MFRKELAKATAALVAKFSADAQSRKIQIQDQMRAIVFQSLDLVRDEIERLRVDEGRVFADVAAAVSVVRQHVAITDFSDPIATIEIEQVKAASGWGDALQLFRPEVEEKRTRLQEQMRRLIIEDFDNSLGELRRLGMESTGQEALDYQQAAAVLGMIRQQLQTQDLDASEIDGPIGNILNVARTAAKADIQSRSHTN